MSAYYNENDPDAAAVLRVLIAEGLIALGIVDERSIEDVRPDELAGYTQCHFFAGFGVWSYALRRAGWPDDTPVWTGSCPCQPFSAAGKGDGFADERHLWPAFYHLISQCRPAEIYGEQVASKAVDSWIDLVHADLEALGYAFGSVPFPSAGVGAPHIRDRNYWVANAANVGLHGRGASKACDGRDAARVEPQRFRSADRMAHHNSIGLGADAGAELHNAEHNSESRGSVRGVADAKLQRRPGGAASGDVSGGREQEPAEVAGLCRDLRPGPTNGHWRDADWLFCRDGKWRPVEPGTFPLAHGATERVGRLRGYGNAINAEAAQAFIESVMVLV